MKGIIIYSSRTGNTKNMANVIYDQIRDIADVEVYNVDDIRNRTDLLDYDFVLLGGWINKGTLDKKAARCLRAIPNIDVGLFATLAALPQSDHGKKVINNLEKLLLDRNSLGQYICPGIVDLEMIKKLKGPVGLIVPKKLKNKMIETSENSRPATDKELEMAGEYFRDKIVSL